MCIRIITIVVLPTAVTFMNLTPMIGKGLLYFLYGGIFFIKLKREKSITWLKIMGIQILLFLKFASDIGQ